MITREEKQYFDRLKAMKKHLFKKETLSANQKVIKEIEIKLPINKN